MIPHNSSAAPVYTKLKVYAGAEHPHAAQQPGRRHRTSRKFFIPIMSQEFIATGRRKDAVARIRMSPGTGKIEVNGRPFDEYFKTVALQNTVLQPVRNREGRRTSSTSR